MPLSDIAVRRLKPRGKADKVYDRDGLFLLVNPCGSKLWRWRYRFDLKEKLMALGEYPVISLALAREHHLAARKILASGIDPMADRKSEAEAKQREVEAREREAENAFEAVARKWWEWWTVGKSPRHTDYGLRRLEADVFPAFGQSLNSLDFTPAAVSKLRADTDLPAYRGPNRGRLALVSENTAGAKNGASWFVFVTGANVEARTLPTPLLVSNEHRLCNRNQDNVI
jgi:hypothetical protein